MIVSVQAFDSYSGDHEDSPQAVALKELFLSSAEGIVEEYLRFSPLLSPRRGVVLSGDGTRRLMLPFRPVRSLEELSMDDRKLEPSLFRIDDDRIVPVDAGMSFTKGVDNIVLSCTAGWEAEEVPAPIVVAILRIATLMLSETDGNIGLTGKSFADNSRTFVNYSNYRKYLEPVAGYRVMRF